MRDTWRERKTDLARCRTPRRPLSSRRREPSASSLTGVSISKRRFTRFAAILKLFPNPKRASHQPASQPVDQTTELNRQRISRDVSRQPCDVISTPKREWEGGANKTLDSITRLNNDYWGNWQFWDGSAGLLDFGWGTHIFARLQRAMTHERHMC